MLFFSSSTATPLLKGVVAAQSAGGKLESIPDQVERLSRDALHWIRLDSLEILIGATVGTALYFALVLLRGRARGRLKKLPPSNWQWALLKVLAKTRSFFLVMLATRIVVSIFGAPSTISHFVAILFTIAAALQGAFWAREFLMALVERKASEEGSDPGLSSAVGVITVIVNVVVWGITGIILLDNLGVDVTALIAGLGIGGIAIGLAAQGIFSDLFAALSILFDKPFVRGDTIQVGGPTGVVGTVENIGLKTTRLRAVSGEIVVMSNTNLLSQQINNFAGYEQRRAVLPLEVIYQTDPKFLEEIPQELERIVNGVALCRFDRAHLTQFNASGLAYELVFTVQDPGLNEMFTARQQVMIAIIRRFAELEIDFAFPAQVGFLAGPDGRIVDPHPPALQRDPEAVVKAARKARDG